MSLSFAEMEALLKEVKPLLEGAKLKGIETISPRTFQLHFEAVSHPLLLCFQEPFLRFHLLQKRLKSIHSPWTHKLQEVLQGQICTQVALLNADRILQLQFSSGDSLIGEFFPKKPNFLLINASSHLLEALNPRKQQTYVPPPAQAKSRVSLENVNSLAIETAYASREFEKEKVRLQKELTQVLKHSAKALDKWQQQIEEAENWPQIQHEGVLLQAHLYLWKPGLKTLEVVDWEQENRVKTLYLDPTLTGEEEIQRRFLQAKKLRKGLPHLEQLFSEAQAKHHLLQERLNDLIAAKSSEELPPKESKPAKKKSVEKPLPYVEFKSITGFRILVGKSAAKNEELTFKHAHGSDLWLHVSEFAGSHVIVKGPKGKPIDRETLLDAMTLAIAYSKAKNEKRAEVIFALQKNVSRIGRGGTGKVQVSHPQKEVLAFDPDRLKKIKSLKG